MNISLTAGMRSNLLTLQQTDSLLTRTQERLATGKKVNSALDNAQSFFAASANTNRVSALASRKDGMGQAVQVVKAADNGINAINALIDQAKGILATAAGTTGTTASKTADDTDLASQFNEIIAQIDKIVDDSVYQGTNLLSADNLVVNFNENASNKTTISGFDATATGLSLLAANTTVGTGSDLQSATKVDAAVAKLDAAKLTLQSKSTGLSGNLGIINARQEFTDNIINTLQVGADKLTLADTNEEGANMLALQTRQQLGVISLNLANQSNQSVLRLF
ncbi:MAG: flagellin [Gammaproteobacteria bacterium]